MSDFYNSDYEISLWEDVLTFVVKYNGETGTREFDDLKLIPESQEYSIEAQYYKEHKVAIIASNTMTTPVAAFGINFLKDINGSNKLTFSIYSRYFDEETEEFEQNPFIDLLANERKVKIKHDGKWYDLIIKNIQENSENYTYTYTAQDLFVNELAKTGFNLEFDAELENNQGTIVELAQRTLEESDWKLKEDACDLLRQYKSEPLYEGVLNEDITPSLVLDLNLANDILAGQKIYCFYSYIKEQETQFFQFIHVSGETIEIDDDHNIINGTLYCLEQPINYVNGIPNFIDPNTFTLSTEYRGKKVIRKQKTKYLPSIDKYIGIFVDTEKQKELYGYTETEYIKPTTTRNLITNPRDFSSLTGWTQEEKVELNLVSAPSIFEIDSDFEGDFKSYIKMTSSAQTKEDFEKFGLNYVYNSGIADSRSFIENFTKGEEYILKVRGGTGEPDKTTGELDDTSLSDLKFCVAEYILKDGQYTLVENGTYFDFSLSDQDKKIFQEKAIVPRKMRSYALSNDSYTINLSNFDIKAVNIGDEVTIVLSSGEKFITTIKEKNQSSSSITLNIGRDEMGLIPEFDTEFYIPQNRYYYEITAACQKSISYETLIKTNIGFFIIFPNEDKTVYIENIELFKKVLDGEGKICYPESIPEAFIKTKYFIFDPEDQKADYKSIEEIKWYCSEYEIPSTVVPVYSEEYEKVRSITISKSNRFNILQTLSEIFECWAIFEVEHDENTGRILYEKDVVGGDLSNPYRQRKFVYYKELVGIENPVGFRQGINLKSTQRTLASDGIVSKLIVQNNSNEFAESGFCTISRADENYAKENFIYNFDYYISQGMLDFDLVTNDLYLDNESNSHKYIGYYSKLRELNLNRDANANLQADLLTAIAEYESEFSTYEMGLNNIEEQIIQKNNEILTICGQTYEQIVAYIAEELVEKTEAEKRDNIEEKYGAEVLNLYASITQLKATRNKYQKSYNYYNKLLNGDDESVGARKQLENLKEEIQVIREKKEDLDRQFYQKYSRFIQEGTWISEDYVDDGLYYLDAESTLYTSAYPQVFYSFNILDVQQLEDYENYKFGIGDKTYVEDTEFFGWIIKDGLKTPRKEEIVVTNINYGVDDPTKTVITIKNYKTHFEDLFQRIAATTQSVQYSTGEYNRAAAAVTTGGTIDAEILNNSMMNNSVILQNASNESVTWDSTGITSVNLSMPAQIIRLTSGGLFVSNDAGENWTTGITANGINASFITAGQIDASVINVVNGLQKTFRWDKYGINAYAWTNDGTYNLGQFVRFDQYGIYGISKIANFIPQDSIDENGNKITAEQNIWNTAQFGLTWKGFFMKNRIGAGWVEVSSVNDISVNDGTYERIKIGRLGLETSTLSDNTETQYSYGIRIKDAGNNIVMETNDDGTLWLKDRLNIGVSKSSSIVGIGNLGKNDSEHGNQVINATDNFIVYEDGHVKATSADISGLITATGGMIGNLNITETGLEVVNKDGNNIISSMVLDDSGLSLFNKTFEIKDSDGEIQLSFDSKNGLYIGTDGTFAGTIEAIAGNIGGFTISDSALYTGDIIDNTPLALYGKKGKIYAKNITLGENAYIENYIKLGNAYICNPIKYENAVIKVVDSLDSNNLEEGVNGYSTISLDQYGIMQVGNAEKGITIDGSQNLIKSSNFSSGYTGWFIDSNTAEFNNIIARGSLKATVFEYGEVQTIGGIVVVRPSSIIRSITNSSNEAIIELESIVGFNNDDVCRIQYLTTDGTTSNDYIIKSTNLEKKEIILNKTLDTQALGKTIISLGRPAKDDSKGSVGIVINSSDKDSGFGTTQAISVFETNIKNGIYTLQPKIILGLLPENLPNNINNPYAGTYGLYAENVLLHGSLVTKNPSNGLYSGIGTDSVIPEISGFFKNEGNILFWAGAQNADKESIQNAPFRVDSAGNFYAGSGHFKGSIITDATITATEIKTAIITGFKDTSEAALTIRNATYGIDFKIPMPKQAAEMVTLSELEMESDETEEVSEKSVFTVIGPNDLDELKDYPKGIEGGVFLTDITLNIDKKLQIGNCYLKNINDSGLFLNDSTDNLETINLKVSNTSYIELKEETIFHNTLTDFKDNGFQMNQTVSFKKVEGGYNLYIDE